MLLLEIHAVAACFGILYKFEIIRGQSKWIENAIPQLKLVSFGVDKQKHRRKLTSFNLLIISAVSFSFAWFILAGSSRRAFCTMRLSSGGSVSIAASAL